jgi:hypothetical protein
MDGAPFLFSTEAQVYDIHNRSTHPLDSPRPLCAFLCALCGKRLSPDSAFDSPQQFPFPTYALTPLLRLPQL